MPFAKLRICPSRSPRDATFSQTSRTNCVGIAIMYLSEKFSAASRSVVQFTLRGSSVSRKQKLLRRVSVIALRLALVYRPHERFVAERREMHGHRRSEAPRAEDSYIHIASSVHLHSPRARAASGLFHYSTAGDESRRRVRARIGCKKPERRNTAPAPMLRSPARFEERLAVCTLNAT